MTFKCQNVFQFTNFDHCKHSFFLFCSCKNKGLVQLKKKQAADAVRSTCILHLENNQTTHSFKKKKGLSNSIKSCIKKKEA